VSATYFNQGFGLRLTTQLFRSRTCRREAYPVTTVCYAQRLEGSRFGLCPAELANFVPMLIPPRRVKTSGSRERLPVGGSKSGC